MGVAVPDSGESDMSSRWTFVEAAAAALIPSNFKVCDAPLEYPEILTDTFVYPELYDPAVAGVREKARRSASDRLRPASAWAVLSTPSAFIASARAFVTSSNTFCS